MIGGAGCKVIIARRVFAALCLLMNNLYAFK